MYNKTIIAGHLTRDIEIKYSSGGMAIGNTAIASSRKFKTQTGEQKEETLFVDITFFGRTAEIANQYLRKGSKVLVDGRLKLDQWTAPDGQKRSKHSVTVDSMQMLDNKGDNPQQAPMGDNGYGNNQGTPQYNNAPTNNYNQPPVQQQSAPPAYVPPVASAPQTAPSIPEINIDEEEIPF